MAAVETTPERQPRRLRLTIVKGFRKKEIERLAERDLAAGSNVVSDGLSCWTGRRSRLRPLPDGNGLGAAGRQVGTAHPCAVFAGARFAIGAAQRGWVNTALGNVKTALAGTYHHVSAKHAQRYLASFARRLVTPAPGRHRIPIGSSSPDE